MTLEELIAQRDSIQNQLNDVNKAIREYSDGFQYTVCIHSYGSHYTVRYSNLQSAVDSASEYYEDNGFAHIFTNNPDVDINLSGGSVYYVENPSEVSAYNQPQDAKILTVSQSSQMYDNMQAEYEQEEEYECPDCGQQRCACQEIGEQIEDDELPW